MNLPDRGVSGVEERGLARTRKPAARRGIIAERRPRIELLRRGVTLCPDSTGGIRVGEKETGTSAKQAPQKKDDAQAVQDDGPNAEGYVQDNSPNAEARARHDTAKSAIQNIR